MAISSADLDTQENVNLFNVIFESKTNNETIEKLEGSLEGVHLINYNTEKIYQLAEDDRFAYYRGDISSHNSHKSRYLGRIESGIIDEADDDLIDPLMGKRLSEMTDSEIESYYKGQTPLI